MNSSSGEPIPANFFLLCSQMTGIDNEGSKSVYGSDVEIITHDSASSISATASSKVRLTKYNVHLHNHIIVKKKLCSRLLN